MAEPITMQKLIDASLDSDSLEQFANDDKIVVSRKGSSYPSAPMASRLVVENGLLGATPFSTYAAMSASTLVDGDYAIVTNDNDLSKNGVYKKSGVLFEYQAYNPVSSRSLLVSDVAVAIVDSNNNQTWLQANNEDGGLTDIAEQAIREKIDVVNKDNVPLMFAVTDINENMTELQVDAYGCVPNEVLNAWSERMGMHVMQSVDGYLILEHDLPLISASQSAVKKDDMHYRNGELLPFLPDTTKVIYIGSSSAERSKSKLEAALKVYEPTITVYAPAMSGGVISHQSTLVGNAPMRLALNNNTVKANGATSASALDKYKFRDKMGAVKGFIDGIEGTMTATAADLSFVRDNPAPTDTPVDYGVEFIPKKGSEYRNALQVIWIGKNNLTSSISDINDVDQLLRDTNNMIDYSASVVKRCIIITHFVNTNTPAVSEIRDRIDRCNRLYKLHYKQNVFDIEPYLLGIDIFTDLSITRTNTDATQQAIGNVPPSLMADGSHLTDEVYNYLMQKLAAFINNKKYLGV